MKGVDLDAPGSINGVPLLEVDLDSFEDKPWRKPGKRFCAEICVTVGNWQWNFIDKQGLSFSLRK